MPLSNWLTDDQIRELLNRYFDTAYHQEDWPIQLRSHCDRIRGELLDAQLLTSLPEKEFIDKVVSIYREVAPLPLYYKTFYDHPKQAREAFQYLLHSAESISDKIDALIGPKGTHRVGGLGKSFWSLILMAMDPENNPNWTNKTDKALQALGMAQWNKSDSAGKVYAQIAAAEKNLIALATRPEADLFTIDHFMYFLEGKEILTAGRESSNEGTEDWTKLIPEWRSKHLPAERLTTRRDFEAQARGLLQASLGNMDEEQLRQFFEYANGDFNFGQVRHDRFATAFVGFNANQIVEQIDKFNQWTPQLWMASDGELVKLVDDYATQKPINFGGNILPTFILYLRDPDRYNIWSGTLAKGLERISDLPFRRFNWQNYEKYNQTIRDLKSRFGLIPQELDVIFTQATRHKIGSHLAEPFAAIFIDRDEANWAFNLLADTLKRLGIQDLADERWAVTLAKRYGGVNLHLIIGTRLILGFRPPTSPEKRVRITFIPSQVSIAKEYIEMTFAPEGFKEQILGYGIPIEWIISEEGGLLEAYNQALDLIAARLPKWKKSIQRGINVMEIAEAILDPDKREDLFTKGIKTPFKMEDVEEGLGRYFSLITFELLKNLHSNPTKDYYQPHKEELKEYVEEPFRQLMEDVAGKLPVVITELLETEKDVFSRFLKNDFGRGNTWDFYWGAFHRKGSRRSEDAQLLLWINYQLLATGFYIGEYGQDSRQRFARNCRLYQPVLENLLSDILSEPNLVFGAHKNFSVEPDGTIVANESITWKEFIQNPEKANCSVSYMLPKSQILDFSKEQLRDHVARIFSAMYPLVILATSESPLPAIQAYLEEPIEAEEPLAPEYSIEQCAQDTGFDIETIAQWVRAIDRKKQAIIYGPPGTGKTYVAEHLAKHLVGGSDGLLELVQFHPAYAYEDFIQGIRPQNREEGGLEYPVVPGRFLEFCERARPLKGTCVMIIDEINRANLARVFGELMYLLEYRDRDIPLAGGGLFRIPSNVRLIGTMNTADRSIALVDHALRRRFAFLALAPNYEVLSKYHQDNQTDFPITLLIEQLKQLNRQIGDPHYEVGISFFLKKELTDQIGDIWQMEIEPYLEEYFFDQQEKVEQFRWGRISSKILK